MVMAWAAVEGWIFGIVLILLRKREEIWSCDHGTDTRKILDPALGKSTRVKNRVPAW